MDHADWCRCGNKGHCDPPYSSHCVCDEGWSGVQCETCSPSVCPPLPEPEPEPDAAVDSESWSGSGYYDDDVTNTAALPVPPTSRWTQVIQRLLLAVGVIGLIWSIKRGMERLIEARRLRKIRKAREIAYRIAKAKGARPYAGTC